MPDIRTAVMLCAGISGPVPWASAALPLNGTTTGVPLIGSAITSDSSPNTSRTRSAVMTSAGVPLAMIRRRHGNDVVRVSARQVQVVQHDDDRAPGVAVERT